MLREGQMDLLKENMASKWQYPGRHNFGVFLHHA